MARAAGTEEPDRRKEARRACPVSTFFAYRRHLYQGHIKNFSCGGLFIRADAFFIPGETITVALPDVDGETGQRRGRIVWSNQEGCGVALLER
jgi:Tfp pilus assembly protein PilZ